MTSGASVSSSPSAKRAYLRTRGPPSRAHSRSAGTAGSPAATRPWAAFRATISSSLFCPSSMKQRASSTFSPSSPRIAETRGATPASPAWASAYAAFRPTASLSSPSSPTRDGIAGAAADPRRAMPASASARAWWSRTVRPGRAVRSVRPVARDGEGRVEAHAGIRGEGRQRPPAQPVPGRAPDRLQPVAGKLRRVAPFLAGRVPGHAVRAPHPHELELHHVPPEVREVLHLPVPDVVVDHHADPALAPGVAAELVDVREPLRDVLAARDDPGGADALVDVLGVVHDHHPPRVVVVDLALVAPVAVVVPDLRVAPRRVVVEHPVGVHHVSLAEHAREGALDHRVVEHELELRHHREKVVARVVVVVLPDEADEAVEHPPVEPHRELGLQGEVAVREKRPHLLVRQQLGGRVTEQVRALVPGSRRPPRSRTAAGTSRPGALPLRPPSFNLLPD